MVIYKINAFILYLSIILSIRSIWSWIFHHENYIVLYPHNIKIIIVISWTNDVVCWLHDDVDVIKYLNRSNFGLLFLNSENPVIFWFKGLNILLVLSIFWSSIFVFIFTYIVFFILFLCLLIFLFTNLLLVFIRIPTPWGIPFLWPFQDGFLLFD